MYEEIWIIGAGHFGQRAYSRLCKNEKFRFKIIDPDTESLRHTEAPDNILIQAEGIQWMLENLTQNNKPEWIIPALPIHLAAQWINLKRGGKISQTEVPLSVDPIVPNPLRGVSIDLYVSHATFKCPDNCPEPEKICTHTKLPRKPNMYDILGSVSLNDYETIVLQSFQLGPGIGGYHSEQLFNALDRVNNTSKNNLLICTACRCHGVISAFKKV